MGERKVKQVPCAVWSACQMTQTLTNSTINCTRNICRLAKIITYTYLPSRPGHDPQSIFKASLNQIQRFLLSDRLLCQGYRTQSVLYTNGFMPFLRTLERSDTQTTFSMIWTRVSDSVSSDNNHYSTCAELHMYSALHSQCTYELG